MTAGTAQTPIRTFSDIPGWFNWIDRRAFDTVLAVTDGSPGGLVELGAYLGRSAVIVGDHRAPGEPFVVVDLFGSDEALADGATAQANRRENNRSYKTLSRRQFEDNYLALHEQLPDVVQGLSSEIVDHMAPGTARFVHVDASHIYQQVATDIANAKTLLRPDGAIVLDDFRAEHTPGVAAAVWAAVANDGLIPFALTPRKFYGTFGSSGAYLSAVRELLADEVRLDGGEQEIHGHKVIRIKPRANPRNAAVAPLTDSELDLLSDKLARRMVPRISAELSRSPATGHHPAGMRGIARDYLPPVLARAIVRARQSRAARKITPGA